MPTAISDIAAAAAAMTAAAAAGQTLPAIAAEPFASGLPDVVEIIHAPGDTERVFAVRQTGEIIILDRVSGQPRPEPFLVVDVDFGGERGLLGLAFDPDFAASGRFYVNYSEPGSGDTIVERFRVDPADPDRADPASAEVIIEVEQPRGNHNAGWMAFGPNDGYLYIALGDSGGAGDPDEDAQDRSTLLGSILRLDVSADAFPDDPRRNYRIPAGNPFAGVQPDPDTGVDVARDETFVFGVRNPYRNAFDPATGDLYIADVGQNEREEITVLTAPLAGGENLGWDCFEGTLRFEPGCGDGSGLTFPAYEYDHTLGRCSITGGEVYRGCNLPAFDGRVFFGDFCSGETFSARLDASGAAPALVDVVSHADELGRFAFDLVAYGRDAFGELYISDRDGEIFRVVPAASFPDANANAIDDACERCNPADLSPTAELFGSLDGNDIGAFVQAFLDEAAPADIAGPFGVVDGSDIAAFVRAFLAGCP